MVEDWASRRERVVILDCRVVQIDGVVLMSLRANLDCELGDRRRSVAADCAHGQLSVPQACDLQGIARSDHGPRVHRLDVVLRDLGLRREHRGTVRAGQPPLGGVRVDPAGIEEPAKEIGRRAVRDLGVEGAHARCSLLCRELAVLNAHSPGRQIRRDQVDRVLRRRRQRVERHGSSEGEWFLALSRDASHPRLAVPAAAFVAGGTRGVSVHADQVALLGRLRSDREWSTGERESDGLGVGMAGKVVAGDDDLVVAQGQTEVERLTGRRHRMER